MAIIRFESLNSLACEVWTNMFPKVWSSGYIKRKAKICAGFTVVLHINYYGLL
jgi:hypothetical protein